MVKKVKKNEIFQANFVADKDNRTFRLTWCLFFKNESSYKMEMYLICIKMKFLVEHIFIDHEVAFSYEWFRTKTCFHTEPRPTRECPISRIAAFSRMRIWLTL